MVLFRPVPSGEYEVKFLNVKKLLAARNLDEDAHPQPENMLYVPQNALSKIHPFLPDSGILTRVSGRTIARLLFGILSPLLHPVCVVGCDVNFRIAGGAMFRISRKL